MGRHNAPGDPPPAAYIPRELTLERVTAALEGLGLQALHLPVDPDRVVVGAPTFVATLWITHATPLTLVADFVDRVPTDFAHSGVLPDFLNAWNRDTLGPTASYRLTDSGDYRISLREGVGIRHGLGDVQLVGFLDNAFELAEGFFAQLRESFIPVGFDHPLPPALSRAQDTEALLGRHPSERHLPRGARRGAEDTPDAFRGSGDAQDFGPLSIEDLEDTLDKLDFSYTREDDDVVTTSVNGVAFALCIESAGYARVTAMWDTGASYVEGFLPVWLMCNDFNERAAGLRAHVVDVEDDLYLYAEAILSISEGLSTDQRHSFVLASLVGLLGAVDEVSTQVAGASVVRWPGPGDKG